MATATERGLDRVVFFTDAVVAIAITLLILPLIDSVPEAAADGTSVPDFLAENFFQLLGFVISFVVIARLWNAHHALFRHVRAHTPMLVRLDLLWAFTIVVLPLPTAVVSQFPLESASVAFYIGTMMSSSIVLALMAVLVSRDRDMEDPAYPLASRTVRTSIETAALFGAALVVGTVFREVNLYALFLLFLTGPIDWAVRRAARRSHTPAPSDRD